MLIKAELRKLLVLARSYYVEYIADHFFFVIGFLVMAGLFDVATDGAFRGRAQFSSLLGYLVWRVAASVIRELAENVARDGTWGILEQVWLTGAGFFQVITARLAAIILFLTLRVIIIALFIIPILRIPVDVPWSAWPAALVFYLMTLLSPFGVALAMIGLQLVYKNISALAFPLATVLLFLTGALVPLSPTATPWIYALSRFLPISSGIDLLRLLLIQEKPLLGVLASPLMPELLLNTTVYLGAGLLIFRWGQKKVLEEGTLAHY